MYLSSIQNASDVEDEVYLGENGDINQYPDNLKLFLKIQYANGYGIPTKRSKIISSIDRKHSV